MSESDEVLRDGTILQVRSIEPGDSQRLSRFHDSLSSDSVRLRFFTFHPHLSAQELTGFTTVDHGNREAFVALHNDEIVGVGRYDRVVGTHSAEIAFTVADAWRGRGIATSLLKRVRQHGRDQGATMLIADMLSENHHMSHVFTRAGKISSRTWDHGVVHIEMPLLHDDESDDEPFIDSVQLPAP